MANLQTQTPDLSGRAFNSTKVVWAMAFMSMVATLLVNGMPVVIGTLGDAYAIPNDQLGLLASAFLVGQFVTVCSSLFWIRRADWQRISLIGMGCSLVPLVTLILHPSHAAFLVSLLLLGATTACFYMPVLAYWSDVDDPARAISIGILLQVAGASFFMFAMPAWFVPAWGVKGLVSFLIGAMVLNLLLIPLIPKSGRASTADRETAELPKVHAWQAAFLPLAGLTVMAFYYVGLFGLWAFLERIGTAGGLSQEATASALSISLLAGTSAVVVTSIVGHRFGYMRPMILSGILYGLFLLFMSSVKTFPLFMTALVLFNLAWNGALPYQIGIIAKSDTAGRYFVLLPAFQAAGAAAGPYVAGLLSVDHSYTRIYFVFIASVAVSFVGYALIAARLRSLQSMRPLGAEA